MIIRGLSIWNWYYFSWKSPINWPDFGWSLSDCWPSATSCFKSARASSDCVMMANHRSIANCINIHLSLVNPGTILWWCTASDTERDQIPGIQFAWHEKRAIRFRAGELESGVLLLGTAYIDSGIDSGWIWQTVLHESWKLIDKSEYKALSGIVMVEIPVVASRSWSYWSCCHGGFITPMETKVQLQCHCFDGRLALSPCLAPQLYVSSRMYAPVVSKAVNCKTNMLQKVYHSLIWYHLKWY